jgi:hypothetical protein
MTVLLKHMNNFNVIPEKTPEVDFGVTDKLTLKCILMHKCRGPHRAEARLR